MDMDGFGSRVLKRSTYLTYIYREPVMFTGFKLFYKNDNNSKMYTPEELLHSHQNQATFNFNNLPSHENYFACLFLGLLLWQAVNPNQKLP
jgi:hypothetical protein